ncbi:MAG: transposase [Chthoniobacterales bacterium]
MVEELCGRSVSSSQVNQCAARLDVELQSWRDRPLGACPYMILGARYEKIRQGDGTATASADQLASGRICLATRWIPCLERSLIG